MRGNRLDMRSVNADGEVRDQRENKVPGKEAPWPPILGDMNFRSPQNWGLGASSLGFKKAGRYLIASP